MNITTLTVGSITYAIKARKLLSRNKISSSLIKIDRQKAAKGCEYGIKFAPKDFYEVVMILKGANIEYSVYAGNDI